VRACGVKAFLDTALISAVDGIPVQKSNRSQYREEPDEADLTPCDLGRRTG
jgi:hypothetical protein